jgi:hypothetical protein
LPTQSISIYPSLTHLSIKINVDLESIELEWKSKSIPIDQIVDGLPLPIYLFTKSHHNPNIGFKIDKKSFDIANIFSTKLNLQIYDANSKKACIL